jgi:DNA primase
MFDNTQLPEEVQAKLSEREWVETFAPESHEIVRGLYKELTRKRAKLVARIDKAFATIDAESTNEDYRYYWRSAFHAKYKLDEQLKDVDTKLARQRRYLRIIDDKPLPEGAVDAVLIQAAKEVPIETIFNQEFRKTGNKLLGLCPFVEEKTPSFVLYLDTNRCYCFGCGAKGNVIDTYMKLYECSFNEAVLTLTGSIV